MAFSFRINLLPMQFLTVKLKFLPSSYFSMMQVRCKLTIYWRVIDLLHK